MIPDVCSLDGASMSPRDCSLADDEPDDDEDEVAATADDEEDATSESSDARGNIISSGEPWVTWATFWARGEK